MDGIWCINIVCVVCIYTCVGMQCVGGMRMAYRVQQAHGMRVGRQVAHNLPGPSQQPSQACLSLEEGAGSDRALCQILAIKKQSPAVSAGWAILQQQFPKP